MNDWLRRVLRRPPPPPAKSDQAMDAQVAELSHRAHTVVQHAARTLQEAKRLDEAMRATEQAVRRET